MNNSIFIENKYTKWYYSIINNARLRELENIYNEKHHIIPKSLGGNNLKENLIQLTAKEHFICHLLLTKMTLGKEKSKMVYAAWALANLNNDTQDRKKITSKTYSILRENFSLIHSANRIGSRQTEETKQKQRKPKNYPTGVCHLKNTKRSESVKSKISNTLSGKKKSEEHKKNMSLSGKDTRKFNWYHSEFGKIYGSKWDIMEKYKDTTTVGLGHVIYGYQKSHRGWSII